MWNHQENQQPRLAEGLLEHSSLHLITYFILLAYEVGAIVTPNLKKRKQIQEVK